MIWEEDLRKGKEAERDFAAILIRRGFVKSYDVPEWNFPDYDLRITTASGLEFTYEVKVDGIRPTSREIWIEYEKKWKPTWIAVSKADFYVYKLGNDYWCCPRGKLVRLLMETKNKRLCQWGDDGTVKLWVIPENDFYSIASKVDEPIKNIHTNSTNMNSSICSTAKVWA